ncbi:MAG: YegS/Rv2252/BmrU family lipid kinase [Alphaproteobacteria bacterium]|nr:YegS/Rv2252/BmrU family lipid kinase [Alphaproteobacteria bacterium]
MTHSAQDTRAAPEPAEQSILVIHNPVAGWWQRNRLRRFLKALRQTGRNVYVRRTTRPGHATQLAAELDAATVATVVAAGGDGTIREVAAGLAGSGVKLAILPLGTANIMALELGVGLNPKRAAALVVAGETRQITSGLVNDRRFLLMASAGLDSRVVARLSRPLKSLLGKVAYIVAAFQEFFSTEPRPLIKAFVDDAPLTAEMIIVTRARRYGGPFTIAPKADLTGDTLFVVAPQGRGRRALLRYALALATNRLHRLPDVIVQEAREVRLTAPEGHPMQVDGDLLGEIPATIRCDRAPLSVIWPP